MNVRSFGLFAHLFLSGPPATFVALDPQAGRAQGARDGGVAPPHDALAGRRVVGETADGGYREVVQRLDEERSTGATGLARNRGGEKAGAVCWSSPRDIVRVRIDAVIQREKARPSGSFTNAVTSTGVLAEAASGQ